MELNDTEVKEYIATAHDLVEEELSCVREEGFWTVRTQDNEVLVSSDDSFHAAILKVSGDFGSLKQQIEYAELIADRLNQKNKSDIVAK